MNKSFYYLFLFFLVPAINAQQFQPVNDSLRREAKIKYQQIDNEIIFIPETPALNQISGAPKAFYTYFWEFGDGNYSTEKQPKHVYKEKGTYEVKLWATNNYDTGKPPATRPENISINAISAKTNEQASMTEDLDLKNNREPVPDEEMLVVLSYKNSKPIVTNGKLLVFYNERKYKVDNFSLLDVRAYNNERRVDDVDFAYKNEQDDNAVLVASANRDFFIINDIILDSINRTDLSSTIEESKNTYKDWIVFEYDNMFPNEERNIFFTFKTTPEMIKDTSAIITIRGVYIPDRDYDDHKVKDMEMEIVTSHDPNKMSTNGTFLNYRTVRNKRVKFKVKFQNNGEGPARTIRLETDIPKMFDKTSLKLEALYPKCEICPKKEVQYSCIDTTFTDDKVIFTFKNIYLPGSEQKNVFDKDSTKGYVLYSLKFGEDFHKKKTKSRTAIYFDKNDPIYTNYTVTRFLPGISIGAKAGYNMYSNLIDSKSYFVGITVSPFKPYRWHWQIEFLNSFTSYNEETNVDEQIIGEKGQREFLRRTTTNSTNKSINWSIPALIRYNINNYIGIGAGIHINTNFYEKQEQQLLIEDFEGLDDSYLMNFEKKENSITNNFSNLQAGFLLDLTAGFARIGPSLGVRYVYNSDNSYSYWQFYARWKF